MPFLKDVCSGSVKSQNVVIEDGLEIDGVNLILILLHSLCKRCDQVLLFNRNRCPEFYIDTVPKELRSKIKIMDCTKLPRPSCIGEKMSVWPFVAAVQQSIQGSNQKIGVVFDSVSMWAFEFSSINCIPQLVKSLLDYNARGNKVEQVVSKVTRGVFDANQIRIVKGCTTTYIRLESPTSSKHHHRAVMTHGEIFEEPKEHIEEFNVTDDFLEAVDVVAASYLDKTVSSTKTTEEAEKSEADAMSRLTSNLTFNLSLKPAEKEAKDKVVLPYTQVSGNQSSAGGDRQGNLIHYVPDDADDFDDEDPDDDLDF